MSNVVTERRIGRFVLGHRVLKETSQVQLQAVFRDMVVLDCRASFATDATEYIAAHPDFEPVDHGGAIPDYTATWLQALDGARFVAWEMVK